MRRAALLLLALALAGCETTAEKSARLEKASKLAAAKRPVARAPSLGRASTRVRVLASTIVSGSEGAAAAITLRNDSPRALRGVPLAITLRDAAGHTVFQNFLPGSEGALISVPSIPAHGELTWVDDQLPKVHAASVDVRVGEARLVPGPLPSLAITGASIGEEPSGGLGASGTIANHSRAAQLHLVLFAVARRGGRVVAAGRAVLPELAAGASAPFHLFFVGDARGAQLQLSAPPVSF
ncbi:MAG TPA: hypothetical protein VNZ05_03880 [Solirubrobacteraceae bacterium]|nr:hypothetical protein [Solirubrobacteraceae bacterium]